MMTQTAIAITATVLSIPALPDACEPPSLPCPAVWAPVATAGSAFAVTPEPGHARAAAAQTVGVPRFGAHAFIERGWFGRRTGVVGGQQSHTAAPGWGLGAGLHYHVTRSTALRASASATRVSARLRIPDAIIDGDAYWMTRGEAAVEWRIRPNVPGYFLAAVDALNNPAGFAVQPVNGGTTPLGIDTGIYPRGGLGIGIDLGGGARRFRLEAIYRVGRYHVPAVGEHEPPFETTQITRDFTMTAGMSFGLR